MQVRVNGQQANFIRDSDSARAWLRVLNLHIMEAQVKVTISVSGTMQANELCSAATAQGTIMCEYTFLGSFSENGGAYRCCPHGIAPVRAAICSPL